MFHIPCARKKQGRYKDKGQGKSDIPDPADLSPLSCRNLIGQKIQHHGCPAGIAAPSPSEDKRSEDLCDSVMDGRRFKYARKKIVPEALDLHVLPAEQAEIDQHVQTYQQLDDTSGISVFQIEQKNSKRYRRSYICKIKQIKQVVSSIAFLNFLCI